MFSTVDLRINPQSGPSGDKDHERDLQVAYHEAGHAIALLAYGRSIIWATIIPRSLSYEEKLSLDAPIKALAKAYRDRCDSRVKPILSANGILSDLAPSYGRAMDYLYSQAFTCLTRDLRELRNSTQDESALIPQIEKVLCGIGEATASGHVAAKQVRHHKAQVGPMMGKARQIAEQTVVVALAGRAAERNCGLDSDDIGATVDYIQARNIIAEFSEFSSETSAIETLLEVRAAAIVAANVKAIETLAHALVEAKKIGSGMAGDDIRQTLILNGIAQITTNGEIKVPL